MLDFTMEVMGNRSQIHPTLVRDGDSLVLIDAGVPGQLAEIEKAAEEAGGSIEDIKKVILTHQDIDHIGSMPALIQRLGGNVEVYAHELDKPYIEGDKPMIKMNPERMKNMLSSMPEETRKQMEQLMANPPKAKVDHTVSDGEVLPFAGGLTVIFTPGHTPGHISLYHDDSKTLITGDAIVAKDGKIVGLNEQATPDMETALKSLERFDNYDIDQAICYHGGLCKGDINEQIKQCRND